MGRLRFFLSPSEGKIYEKLIGMDGLPVFRVYEVTVAKEEQKPVYAELSALSALQQKVDKLEQAMKKGTVKNDRKSVAANANSDE